MLSHYLTTDNDPEKLLIYSNTQNIKRTYWVQSLHVSTFRQSRNFLDRYRLRALIVELIETDPDETTLEERNIDWLIRRYFAEIRPRDQDRRIIADPESEPGIDEEPRHLRHIPHAEIRGYFAAQAEWLLANQIASNGPNTKLVDIPQWMAFCREARKDSLEANLHGVNWGLSHGQKIDSKATNAYDIATLATRLSKFGQTVTFWKQQLKNASQRKKRSVKRKQPSPEIELLPNSTPPVVPFQYDSDFSDASTPNASDTELESKVPTHWNGAPHFCFRVPRIPNGGFTWRCPGCSHTIDLLNISPQNLGLLPNETVRILSGKSWRVHDDPVQDALFLMVSHHYKIDHLNANGMEIQPSKKQGVEVKMEEDVMQPRRSVRIPKIPHRLA
ncbi:hypothetical protein BDZ97DRAFT_1915399 [Flammula alnicola]|nr:hypothetical protein BDZ97DRAFT_1915399 [Flammula alnicola]